MALSSLALLLGAVSVGLALASQETFSVNKPKVPTSLPVVFWHGLGDTYNGEGLMNIADIINETYPGTFIHSIYIDQDPSADRKAGFLGHLDDQVPPITFSLSVFMRC
jgi:ABC-type glycerol-3-phosphate transport system substrate-binding protein